MAANRPQVRLVRAVCAVLLAFMMLPVVYGPVSAQTETPAPDTQLRLLEQRQGQIDTGRFEQRWTFSAQKWQRLSARMQAISGNLDPYFELLDSSGAVLGSSVPSSFRNATLDAYDIPATGEFVLRATFKGTTPTAGAYTISILPGFSFLVLNDPVDSASPMRTWRDVNSVSQFSDGKLRLQLKASNSYTWTAANKLGKFKDLYLQANFRPEPTAAYWEAGLLVRGVQQTTGFGFYTVFVNSKNQWKLAFSQAEKVTTLQDWVGLPEELIKPGQVENTLGVMALGKQFTIFFNGLPVGDVTDTTLDEAGLIGVTIGTGLAPDDLVSVLFDNFVVTLPATDTDAVIIPQKLTQWQRPPDAILGELQTARLIPGAGKLSLGVDQAFVTNNTSGGIVIFPLAKAALYRDLVYAADVTWDSNNEDVACAMEFRAADADNFSIVYFDRHGGYGIRQVGDGQNVIAQMYDLSDAVNKANKATNRILIIAVGNGLVVYINGVLVGNLNVKQVPGNIYIAAYNYKQASNVCQFQNIWIQNFD